MPFSRWNYTIFINLFKIPSIYKWWILLIGPLSKLTTVRKGAEKLRDHIPEWARIVTTVLYSYVMCTCDMAQSPTCSLCCSKKEQMRLNQWQKTLKAKKCAHLLSLWPTEDYRGKHKQACCVTAVFTSLFYNSRGSTNNSRNTCTAIPLKVGAINCCGFHWIGSLFGSISVEWTVTPSSWDRCAVWDQQVINYLIWLSHLLQWLTHGNKRWVYCVHSGPKES